MRGNGSSRMNTPGGPMTLFSRFTLAAIALLSACNRISPDGANAELESLKACDELVHSGFRPVATSRDQRFLGKVQEFTALCRGGNGAAQFRKVPWVDWGNYWGVGDTRAKA